MTASTRELFSTGRVAKKQPFVHGSHNLTGAVEWYTPAAYVESARRVMGSIDVDPCTSAIAQKTVKASEFYTIDTNGLLHKWSGNVWMNPPYASRIITAFVDKLLGHLATGDVLQAIMLTHNNADTAWFHKAATCARAVCFTRGRVRFYNANGTANSPTHGHCFAYFGPRWKRFAREFSQYGWIARGVA
jgi:hypothetical protein